MLGAAYKGYYQILKVLVELGGNYLYKQPVSTLCVSILSVEYITLVNPMYVP